ncbi:MAG: FAD:protein FMN transferase [Acidobacteriota bacterium]|nr:FAD:protein FMN transferase [Acidobacteriota bacterium]
MNVHRFRAMGCDVVLAGGDPAAAASVFERWEEAFSLFRPSSEIARVNAAASPALAVSPFLASTLQIALDVAADTDGLVVPALGEVRLRGGVLSRPPGVQLDLNGVVKALAVDEAAARLAGPGFVSCGGDLAVRGPVDVGLPGGGAVLVVEGGLATSGTATRGRHLLDPRTGEPSDSPWSQVTVSGSTCLAADVAAKAAYLLGHDGPAWLDARGMPGRFVDEDGSVMCNAAWDGSLVCT